MLCQKCSAPVTPHGSLVDLSPAAFNLLTEGSSSAKNPTKHRSNRSNHNPNYAASQRELYDRASSNSSIPVIKRSATGAAPRFSSPLGSISHTANPADSFVMLTDSVFQTPDAHPRTQTSKTGSALARPTSDEDVLTDKMRSAKLFDVISSRSDIDYPTCVECTEVIVEGLQARLAQSTKERDAYQVFVKRVQAHIPTDEEKKTASEELEKVQAEHEAAIQELERVEKMKMDVEAEIAELESESTMLQQEEDIFWRERNAFSQKLDKYQNERESVNLRYDHDAKQLERLQRTNVYNDAFCIGHDGYFGTINTLRLGKLPSQPVEWAEINAAWGQTLLLLQTVADKLNFKFEGYRLKPMGSLSTIEKIEPRDKSSSDTTGKSDTKVSKLDLFSSGTIPMGHLFAHRRFDGGMVAFLDCVRQLGDYVHKQDPRVELPYAIVKDKIGDQSIRLTFNQDEPWTKACKYALTCAKFLLAHASNQGFVKKTHGAANGAS